MSAELELAAWDITGEKLWTMFVEPPWSYQVNGENISVDVMGVVSGFKFREGPRAV